MGTDVAVQLDLSSVPVDPFELVGGGFAVESLTADHALDGAAPFCACIVHTHVQGD